MVTTASAAAREVLNRVVMKLLLLIARPEAGQKDAA
jgi:hypothetical protein